MRLNELKFANLSFSAENASWPEAIYTSLARLSPEKIEQPSL
jgi:hypothetical protein